MSCNQFKALLELLMTLLLKTFVVCLVLGQILLYESQMFELEVVLSLLLTVFLDDLNVRV